MKETTFITYEGIEFEVVREYDSEDLTTGYKGGWSILDILIDGNSIYWMLRDNVIEHINEIL